MPDYKNFRAGFNSGSSDPKVQQANQSFRKAVGLSTPDDDDDKKRNQSNAIKRRARFYSDEMESTEG